MIIKSTKVTIEFEVMGGELSNDEQRELFAMIGKALNESPKGRSYVMLPCMQTKVTWWDRREP